MTHVHEIMNGSELCDHRWRQDEGVKVRPPHRPIQIVEGIAQRNPGVDQFGDITRPIRIEVDFRVKIAALCQSGMDINAERGRHFQRVYNVKVVSPGFCEIFPRVRGRVASDKAFLPIRRSAVGIMSLQCLLVIGAFIAENLTEGLQFSAITNQPVPVVVSDLMAKVTEQRAVGLMQ